MKFPLTRTKSLLFIVIVCQSFLKVSANTFATTQDGNWEDSTSWNNVTVPTNFSGSSSYDDTIIIRHHITFSNPLQLHFVIIRLDSGSSICGYDSIHLWNSEMLQLHATVLCYRFNLDSSYWFCDGGFSICRMGMSCHGDNHFLPGVCMRLIGAGGKQLEGFKYQFICSLPPITWQDTILPPPPPPPAPVYYDTVEVSVDPNQSFDNFTVKSYLSQYHTNTIMEVFDLLGVKRYTLHIPVHGATQTIYAEPWPAGIYILRVSENGTVFRVLWLLKVK